MSMVRCLTLISGYAPEALRPDWDVCYPDPSDILQLISHDSAKRGSPSQPVLVFQCRPGWSASHWDDEPRDWTETVLGEAQRICGDEVGRPSWIDTQRWRFARLSEGESLRGPLMLRMAGGAHIGIAGEALDEDGGVQAAWRSGRRLASRLLSVK